MAGAWCGICGRPYDSGSDAGVEHASCERRRDLEPPRYCAACGRRMVVQVTPAGWTARCSEHGRLAG